MLTVCPTRHHAVSAAQRVLVALARSARGSPAAIRTGALLRRAVDSELASLVFFAALILMTFLI